MGIQQCILCGRTLTSANSGKEHIIPNAIGGRKKVDGFICRDCNNVSGSKWDADLASKLNPFSLRLGIARQRGPVPSQKFPTYSGESVCLKADGTMTLADPKIQVTTDRSTTTLRIKARTKNELKQILEGQRKKYPQLRRFDLDALVSATQYRSYYSADPIEINGDFGGAKSGRSLVKSAVALVYDAGIDPRQCDLALDYLLNDGKEACFGYYYDSDKDLIVNRPSGLPFHCVYVRGCGENSTLVGYIEFYSLWRVVLCLSESYTGNDFTHVYAVDPIQGEELDIEVKFDLSMLDIREAYEYKRYDYTAFENAISNVLDIARKIDFERARNQAIQDAIEAAVINSGTKEEDILTDEQRWQFAGEIARGLMPFIIQNFTLNHHLADTIRHDKE